MSVTMATRVPARMPAGARREQLLDVTKAIVAERGFHAVSIEGVAREAGISRPIVYGHFDDLPGLLDALVKREGARALGQLAEVLPPALAQGAPEERLAAALGAYLEAVRADPATWRLVLVPHEGAPAVLHEAISRGREAVVAQLAAALGSERGLRAPDPELAAHLLSALADEAARLLLADPDRYPPERVLALARWFLARMVSPV
jgi:AcrR family transcriptional regulator